MNIHIKRWCPEDVDKLTALYFMGATDQEISKVLKRTPESIEKKVTRLGFRVKNTQTHFIAPGRFFPKESTLEDITKCLENALSSLKHSKNLQSSLLQKNPLQHYPKKSFSPEKRKKVARTPVDNRGQWRTKKEIVEFLEACHYRVEPLAEGYQLQRTGCTYLLNGMPKSSNDLLVLVNKVLHRKGEDPVFLEGITRE